MEDNTTNAWILSLQNYTSPARESPEYNLTNYTLNDGNGFNFTTMATIAYHDGEITEETREKILFYNNVEFRIWQIISPTLLGKLLLLIAIQ